MGMAWYIIIPVMGYQYQHGWRWGRCQGPTSISIRGKIFPAVMGTCPGCDRPSQAGWGLYPWPSQSLI